MHGADNPQPSGTNRRDFSGEAGRCQRSVDDADIAIGGIAIDTVPTDFGELAVHQFEDTAIAFQNLCGSEIGMIGVSDSFARILAGFLQSPIRGEKCAVTSPPPPRLQQVNFEIVMNIHQ